MALVDRLRQMAEAVPPGGAVIVPRDWLEAELQALGPAPGEGGELTVEQVAQQLHRPESTIRDWLDSRRFTGAYKRGRVWRVPRSALKQNRGGDSPERDKPVRLDAWRSVRRRRHAACEASLTAAELAFASIDQRIGERR